VQSIDTASSRSKGFPYMQLSLASKADHPRE
jgi:hypothetical protein